MALDPREIAVLAAIDALTRDTLGSTDGEAVMSKLDAMGVSLDEAMVRNIAARLRDEGYISSIYFAGGSLFRSAAFIELSEYGRDAAREGDPMERTHTNARAAFVSDAFREAYPDAFRLWADAEALYNGDDAEAHLTAIGHKARESMQAFATALVDEYEPPGVDTDPAHARARLGAVIAMHRPLLGKARRVALEALGDLWEATDDLVQRQEHGAQKEGDHLTLVDAHRIVWLTMFLMVEFVMTLEDVRPEPETAVLEPGR